MGGRRGVVLTAFLLAMSGSAAGEPLAREDVPEPLVPWVDWVLSGVEDADCPFVHGIPKRRQCTWPSRLRLSLGDERGEFRQEWRVYGEVWVPLPGDAKIWPQEVRVGERAAVVVARGDRPMVRLRPGRHVLTGSLRWPRLPESLQLPPETGLVSIKVRGKSVAFPNRDLAGRLWLQKPKDEDEGESRLDVTVHRRVLDEVPPQLET